LIAKVASLECLTFFIIWMANSLTESKIAKTRYRFRSFLRNLFNFCC
jgi:hypothetical protein